MDSRTSKTLFVACAFTLSVMSTTLHARTGQSKLISNKVANEVHNSFICVFNDGVPASEVHGNANLIARSQGGRVTHTYKHTIKGFAAKMPPHAAERIAANNPNIAYCEPDAVAFTLKKGGVPGGPDRGDGGDEGDVGDVPSCAPAPWGVTRVGGSYDGAGTTVWVIDTGVDLDHPDLYVSPDISSGGLSKNFVEPKSDSANDGNGHGTHVAGTIAAKDNCDDVVGVAAGAKVVAVRVLGDDGSGTYSDVIRGVDYVAGNASPGDVANMSLGGSPFQPLDDAVRAAANAGVLFSIAAGNERRNANNYSPARAGTNDDGTLYPNIYVVSAIDSNDKWARFSNYGNPPIYCAAPGVSILSTYKDGQTATLTGTSMAAPHVAGLLLVGLGDPDSDGFAIRDPDREPDSICHF